jgi:transposase
MTEHTPVPKLSRLEVITTGARRRWAVEEKRRIVAESYSAPRLVSATARRYGISTSQLYTWRRLALENRLGGDDGGPGFAPAVIVPERPASAAVPCASVAATAGRMEIVLAGAQRVIVARDVDAAALARVIEVLERR